MLLPTLWLTLATLTLACSVIPAALFCINLRRYRAPQAATPQATPLAVLVPARNEAANIAACLASVLASTHTALEVLVLDDASTDDTAAIVTSIAQRDPRVRLLQSPQLPVGWNGKQHACWLLAQQSTAQHLVFLDADVRLAPDSLPRCLAHLQRHNLALLSGFPRQLTIGLLEQLVIPLIHFVLLAFLPMGRMDRTTDPAFSAGCGQFFLVNREAYFASGGHAAVRSTRHDGLKLPQLLRSHGHPTGLVDMTELATVRMYDSASAVWLGLAKNATEGLAAPARIVPLSLILILGQVVPTVAAVLWLAFNISALIVGATMDDPRMAYTVTAIIVIALLASYLPRLLAVRRFHQPLKSALLHPFGILVLLAIQWYALLKQIRGSHIPWRNRI